MAASLRPHPPPVHHTLHSPTTSSSEHSTTPTSPHFHPYPGSHSSHPPPGHAHAHARGQHPHTHQQQSHHPYANRSGDLLASTSTLASTSRSPISVRPATPPLLHPSPGQTFSAYLASWTSASEQLGQFLALHKCGQYAEVFRKNDIDGTVLLDLDMAALKELGVRKVGERVKLLSGIKDLRRRASGLVVSSSSMGGEGRGSGVELRLNGAATPSPDWIVNGSIPAPVSVNREGINALALGMQPRINDSTSSAHRTFRPTSHERSMSHSGSQSSSMGDRRGLTGGNGNANGGLERSLSSRRPPPLDLHSSSRGHTPSSSYSQPRRPEQQQQPMLADLDAPASASTQRAITPRPSGPSSQPQPLSLQRPSISSQTSSSATITPSSLASSSSRSAANQANLTLRAPPSRDPNRRSPSPINDPSGFMDRPLPPAPAMSSAAEYARQHAGTPTLAPLQPPGTVRGPSPSLAERRLAPQSSMASLRDQTHRKTPSSSGQLPTQPIQGSPIKGKFSSLVGRAPQQQPVHPFAATRDAKEISPPKERERDFATRGPQVDAQIPRSQPLFKSGSVPLPNPPPPRNNSTSSASNASNGAPMSLEDLRRQLVKFINSEDGTTRTVNVSSCSSGVEVLERVLKKFGKWNTGNVSTDGESEEEGERLEVDGWGVYTGDAGADAKPLSEAALLGICLSHRDGSTVHDRGLVLRRSRKNGNRKNMSEFLGEQPPTPLSPTSPTYFGGPRLGITQAQEQALLTPTKRRAVNTNRASMVSVMSGLGVLVGDAPPSPSASARSPSSGSFLPGSRRKMYNFFGHRPPSELISNHLAEYFPSAKKKELDKTVRKSIYRQSIYGGGAPGAAKRGSIAPSVMSGRDSVDLPRPSPPRKRPVSRMTMSMASPPNAPAIPEAEEGESEADGSAGGGGEVPRMSVSDDSGSVQGPRIDGDSSAVTTDSDRPPLLPAFEPFNESLADSLQAFSTQKRGSFVRPPSLLNQRRNSAGSTRSRMSTLSQLRRNRDRSDTASMLTVDEITAEVENRRASTISFDETSDEEEPAVLGKAVLAAPPQMAQTSAVPEDEGDSGEADESGEDEESDSDESDGDDDEDDDDDEEEEDDEDEVGKDHGKAYTSTGSGRIIKWIKGALIGAGSFGSVYLGMDAQSGLLMAVKQVEMGSGKNVERKRGMIEALEREIELLKELQHDNIVQYLDSSVDGTHLNIFLEYVPGGSIAALLSNYGAFEEALVRNFVRQILTGLNYLHEREIIHRDIKGANILVDNKGGIKISDFGISKKVESNLLQGMGASRPSLQGSVFWMAPEIVKQTSYTSKADIWSVGCLVVEMLTGTHPWADLTQMQAIFRIGQAARPAIPNDITPEAAALLNSTFEIDCKKRPTAAELLECDFMVTRPKTVFISEAQAKASMAAAHAGAQKGMAGIVGVKA